VFRDAGDSPVGDGDNIAFVTITGASPDFQLTFGASSGLVPSSIGPFNGVGSVYLGQITADSVIWGINTVTSTSFAPGGGPSTAINPDVAFILTSFVGVNFSKGGGLFVDVVTGEGESDYGILLTNGFSPYATIGIREQLDAVMLLGAKNGAKADGRLLIESATAASRILVNNAGDTRANSKLEILGGAGPFDAGVLFRGTFSGAVNLQSPAGGSWVFQSGVGPAAVLTAATWEGLTDGAPLTFPGLAVFGDFAGALNATAPLVTNVSVADVFGGIGLTVAGSVKGTARVNSATGLDLRVQGNVLPGAQFNAVGPSRAEVEGNFSGAVSAGDDLLVEVGGNVSGAKLLSAGDTGLTVGATPVVSASAVGPPRSIVNSSVVSAGDIALAVTGDVVKSSFVGRNIFFGGLVPQGDVTVNVLINDGIRGGVRNATFSAGGSLEGTVGGSVVSSVLQGQGGLTVGVAGSVANTRFVTTEGELAVTTVRDFQGTIQGGVADVRLSVDGSVLKGSSLLTGGDAEVSVARNFDGSVTSDDLRFFVDGNVAKASRIVAARVSDFNASGEENFRIGGRFDGILNVGVFDAAPGDFGVVEIIGGGAGTSARFYGDRFLDDAIKVVGDFRGNIRVLQDLTAVLVFDGDVDRITIGGQVLATIGVRGRLLYLNSNSYFVPNQQDKRTGLFVNGSFQQTGFLATGSYVTVLPLSPVLP
jgi:hypothetical protein